jgi:hypothetical protein
MGEMMNKYKFFVGNLKRRNRLEYLSADGWEMLKMSLCEIWSEGVEWIDLAVGWDR